MKNILTKAGLFVAWTLTVVSCLKDKDVTTYPQCAITAFTVGNITTKFHTKTRDGLYDSIYTRVIDGRTIGFNIDQVKSEIESVDSIINWADISRVVPTVTYSGLLFCKQRGWEDYYSFTSGVDSVDFTQDVEFLVISSDQQNSRVYKAKLNKAKIAADSLYWTDFASTGLSLEGPHRSIALDRRIYTFAADGGTPTVTTLDTENPTAWTAPTALTGCSTTIDVHTIVIFQDQFYALSTDGQLYRSGADSQGVTWTAVGSTTLDRLLCADKNYLYAYDGIHIVQTSDLSTWEPNGSSDLDLLPESPVQSVAYSTQTNAGMQHVVMLGLTGTTEKTAATWYKVSAVEDDIDQPWSYVPAPKGTFVLPALQNLTMVRLGSQLLAFGGADANTGDTKTAYKTLYASTDQGLSWHPYTTKMLLPEKLSEHLDQAVTAVVVGDQLWLIQSGGKVWRGLIGRSNP